MRIAPAVRGPLVYLDTNAFVDLVEGQVESAAAFRQLFEACARAGGAIVTSEITLAEALAPSKQFGSRSPPLRERYLKTLVSNPSVLLVPVSRSILLETVDIRRHAGQKLVDAIHCATAVQTNCSYLVSRDRDFRRLPEGLAFVDSSTDAIKTLIRTIGV